MSIKLKTSEHVSSRSLTPLWINTLTAIVVIVLLLLGVYVVHLYKLRSLIIEVDQRLNLELATKLAPRIIGVPLDNRELIREELRKIEREFPRLSVYVVARDGYVEATSHLETTDLPLPLIDVRTMRRVLNRGEAVLPRLGTNPANPTVRATFSVAPLDQKHNRYLYLLLGESAVYPEWRIDSSFRSLRELRTHLILSGFITALLLSIPFLRAATVGKHLDLGGIPSNSSAGDGTTGLVTTVTAITNVLQEKTRLLAQHRAERRFIVGKVSQEISAPLSLMSNYMQQLDEQPLVEEERQGLLRRVSSELDRLIARIDTIFRIVKYDALTNVLESECIHAYECIQDTAQQFESVANLKTVTIAYEVPLNPIIILGDTELIHEAFTYLVREGVAQAPQGTEVRLEADEEGNNVVLRVSFNAFRTATPYSFERPNFTCSEEQRERLFGLYIARRIAEAHGGRAGPEERNDGLSSLAMWVRKRQGGKSA